MPKAPPIVIVLPRRLLMALGLLALVLVVWRIQQPPVVLVQRLDSPDGERRAFLQRTKYVRDHLRVRVSGGGPSFIAYLSPPYDHDFRVDLGERLRWNEDGTQLILRINGRDVWRYDRATGRGRDLDPDDAW
ncbi:MAG TPA: hypothetical protein PKE12_00220 [Kiritimatiellia bacterium]|nr:hypothetical protein [Kiritimatiellia bacterium]